MMENGRKVVIIGGGVAGLSAGIYARLNGFATRIIEQHFLPGGLCTSWERGGYVFDGCLSYLYGTAPGAPFSDLWRELGVAGLEYAHRDEFIRVRDPGGREAVAWADPERLREHLLSLSPGDKRRIDSLCDAVAKFASFDLSALCRKPRGAMGPLDWARFGMEMLPWAADTSRWALTSAEDYAAGFRDPFLRCALRHFFGWPEIPMLAGISLLSYVGKRNAGFPVEGSLALARALEKSFVGLGGSLLYRKRVERILVRRDRAVGVRLFSDEEFPADYVVSTADERTTAVDMLDGKYGLRRVKRRYDGRLPLHSQIQVSLGVRRDLSSVPPWTIHLFGSPYRLLSEDRDTLSVKHFAFAPRLSPEGRNVVEICLPMEYGYFRRIYGNKLYDSEQEQTADQAIGALERVMPGIRADIEVVDVATPISYERYTGSWQGSSCGWLLTKRTMLWMIAGVQKTLPGLGRLLLAGQWVEPGGSVPICAASGRNAVEMICREEGLPFRRS